MQQALDPVVVALLAPASFCKRVNTHCRQRKSRLPRMVRRGRRKGRPKPWSNKSCHFRTPIWVRSRDVPANDEHPGAVTAMDDFAGALRACFFPGQTISPDSFLLAFGPVKVLTVDLSCLSCQFVPLFSQTTSSVSKALPLRTDYSGRRPRW